MPEQNEALHNPLATFHPFPHLPAELRVQIWGLATEDRVLRVRKARLPNGGFWSPTPVPSVTQTCWESRQHCSYQRAFTIASCPRYIWTNFDHDVIRMGSEALSAADLPEKDNIKHLRIELLSEHRLDSPEIFYHYGARNIRTFPFLHSFSLIVTKGLAHRWTDFIARTSFGVCPRDKVRIVDGATGEWIDEQTSPVYQDYVDTSGGQNRWYARDAGEDDDEENRAMRLEAMKTLPMPLPRVDLNKF